MDKYTFKCGCSFNILKESESKDTIPYLDVDENNLPFCQNAWDLLSTGMTKGIFQLESDLGRTWCKKLKPENAEQLGALGAILRPGPLKSLDNEGISMTEHYCLRKNREEEIKPYHPNVDKHLLGTYNNLIYQEQIIALSKELAGLSDAEADKLRKCLDGDTKFYSKKRGKVSIKELINSDYKNEEFLTVDENNNKVWKKIEKIWYTGKLKTYEVIYKYRGKLYSVICTGNHKILTSKGFIEASNLKKSDKIKFCLPNELVVYASVFLVKEDRDNNPVYDFTMEDKNIPWIWADYIFVHNSVGKKDQQLLAKIKKQFIEGCSNKKIISDKQAEEVWGWIEKSGRYCFNKSHAISYGLTGYDTAYLKSHFPIEFFTNWLYYAKEKIKPQEEIRELVREAKSFNIKVNLPDIRKMNEHFFTDRKEIWFGLTDIKDVGNATIQKFKQRIQGNDIKNMSWFRFLTEYSNSINIRALKALCYVGAFSWTGKTRNRLYNEVSAWQQLTEKEQDKLKEKSNLHDDLLKKMKELCKTVKEGGICSNKNRVEVVKSLVSILENPPNSEIDNNNFICWAEQNYLGCNLSVSKIDDCDTTMINSSIKEIIDGKTGYIVLGAEVKRVKAITTKTGKKMCFLEITDGTNSIDSVTVFPEQYKEFGYLFIEGNTVLLECQIDKKSKNLIVNKGYQI